MTGKKESRSKDGTYVTGVFPFSALLLLIQRTVNPLTMKKPWLILAAVLAFVAVATSVRQNQTRKYSPPRRFQGCIGCYTALAKPTHREIALVQDESSTLKIMEPINLQPLPEVKTSRVGGSISPILEPSELAPRPFIRTKRDRKKAAFAPRRGKQRAGTRPVCRGCYSGLMIIAPPVQESQNGSFKASDSESGGDSSGED